MRFWMMAICGALIGGSAGFAAAGPSIDWDPAHTWEIGATATYSPPGGEFKSVGIVDAFDAPFGDLDANDPSVEYTFYVYGLISTGTDSSVSGSFKVYTTNYTGGFIDVYCDTTPEPAMFTINPPNAEVPSDFTDGTLILSGEFTSFFTQTNNFSAHQIGNLEGEIEWTGGTLYERTQTGGPCTGLYTGGITWNPDIVIEGYIFHHDGKIDLQCPTPVENKTWGKIKAIYQ